MFNERITVYWLIAAVILVVLEMFVGTFYLLVKIEQHLHDNVYQVHYRGTVWQAQLQDTQNINIGQTAYISARQGNVLLIRSTL